MWFFGLLAAAAVLLYLFSGKKKKGRKGTSPRASRKRARPVFSVSDLAGFAPITTQAAAVKALEHLLVSAGYAQDYKSALRETLSDFRQEMREHSEALQSDIDEHKHELEYEREQLDDPGEAEDDETDADRAENARQINRVRALEASLAQDVALLKQYKVDRAEFIAAYANHVLHDAPDPNRDRQQAVR